MPSRKRSFDVSEALHSDESKLQQIRNMWQFANLYQWIYTFGKTVKIDESIDIEDLETECLKPTSTVLTDIAIALLRLVTNHRGITIDILDAQAQKLYLSKAPEHNPFGSDDVPLKFQDLDVFAKVKFLQQLTQWAMIHPERFREKMEEQKDIDQTSWRIEPYGWDSDDRTYFVLDDNRVYRLTEPPPTAALKPKKKKSKTYRSGRRSSKRRRTGYDTIDEDASMADEEQNGEPEDDGLGGMTWECLAITLQDVQKLIDGFRKSRDENEKILRKQLEDHLLPILEKQEESRKRKALQRERELLNLAKMANAKRSSRLAGKAEQKKQEDKAREELVQQRQEEEQQRREEKARLKIEQERESRLVSREQRVKEREARRVQHEDELAQLSEDSKRTNDGQGRASARHLQAEIEKNRQALMDIDAEDEEWTFDCICGLHGQVDDGAHSVACEKCSVWQHSKCLNISEEEAERPEFHFVCKSCLRRSEEARAEAERLAVRNESDRLEENRLPSDVQKAVGSMALPATEPQPRVLVDTQKPSPTTSLPSLATLQNSAPQLLKPTPATQPVSSISLIPTSDTDHDTTLGPVPPAPHQIPSADHDLPKIVPNTPVLKKETGQDVSRNGLPACSTSSHQQPSPHHSSPQKLCLETPSSHKQLFSRDPGPDTTLSTPTISREIYRAAHMENGNLPSHAGISPTKQQSPHSSFTSIASNGHGTNATILPPGLTLSPSPHEPILTPPTKQPDGTRTTERS